MILHLTLAQAQAQAEKERHEEHARKILEKTQRTQEELDWAHTVLGMAAPPQAVVTALPSELVRDLQSLKIAQMQIVDMLPTMVIAPTVTPTNASRNPVEAEGVFETLAITTDRVVRYPADAQKRTDDFIFRFQDNSPEHIAYGPVCEYLRRHRNLNAHVVANGQKLLGGVLFDRYVYSLRLEPTEVHSQKVVRKQRVKGRTDIVVLSGDASRVDQVSEVHRGEVLFAIEIKTPKDLSASTSGGAREAKMQLVGLNVDNCYKSPVVVLTNLAKTHEVFQLTRTSLHSEAPKFEVVRHIFKSFAAAIDTAIELSKQMGVSMDFARPPTPQSSDE